MRRYAFYLTVALLAFGISSFVVFEFYRQIEKPVEQIETSQTVTVVTPADSVSVTRKHESISKLFRPLEEICAEKKCIGDGSLKPLIAKWHKGEKLKNEQTSLWTLKEPESMSEEAALPSLVDLDSDNKKELILQSQCAAVGNCQFDVFIKKGKRYSNLLSTSMVQVFEVLGTSTNGFKDLHLRTHGSAFDSYHRVLKFNGRKYIQKKCWDESYEKLDEKGKRHVFEKPIITVIKCQDDF